MSWRMKLSAFVRLLRDARGVAALEFALVVPAVIVLYAGGYEIAQAATVNRKVTDTTVQLARVTTEYTTVADTDLAQISAASTQIMDPAPVSPLTLTISEVQTDPQGSTTAKVVWSRQYTANGGGSSQCGLSVGTTVPMPIGLPVASQNYIFVQTSYTYQTTIGSAFVNNLPMSDQIFMLPRESGSIPCTSSDCFC
jgi:Flp pilus assembly protein TadG